MGVHRHALDGVRGRAHRQRVGLRGRLQVRNRIVERARFLLRERKINQRDQ
jgi:hypothetical protein